MPERLAPLLHTLSTPVLAMLCAIALSWLGGCAGIDWERSVYEGVRHNAAHPPGDRTQPGRTAPSTQLPAHADYHAERERLRTGGAAR